ncbi:hypothetical protein QZH41_005125 [Actinostola sp. cb2023]|nr:hypothetical protein QZH41_005125 [Actinostola sp. cb2023]
MVAPSTVCYCSAKFEQVYDGASNLDSDDKGEDGEFSPDESEGEEVETIYEVIGRPSTLQEIFDKNLLYNSAHIYCYIFWRINEGHDNPILHSTPFTPGGSFYIPPRDATCSDVSFDDVTIIPQPPKKPLDALNEYLNCGDISPVRSQLKTSWENTSERTKRYYVRKTGQGVAAMVKDIAPQVTGSLFKAVCSSQAVLHALCKEEEVDENTLDVTLMEALAESYQASDCWESRRQILSIMADKVQFKKLLLWIPGLTKYRFTEAKRHCLAHGRGAQLVPSGRGPRMDISTEQINHFISFITSSHIVQDLPFGEKTVTL